MNYADVSQLTVADVDAQLREMETVRALLNGLGPTIGTMLTVLGRTEDALRKLRVELAAHAGDVAAREATRRAEITASHMLTFASMNGPAPSVTSH